jgi:hypothetical protein
MSWATPWTSSRRCRPFQVHPIGAAGDLRQPPPLYRSATLSTALGAAGDLDRPTALDGRSAVAIPNESVLFIFQPRYGQPLPALIGAHLAASIPGGIVEAAGRSRPAPHAE